jgi:hypothetical protein
MRCLPERALSVALALFVVFGVARCTEDSEQPQGVLAPLPPGPPIERTDPYRHSGSRFGIVHLHAGFNPDPRVVEGTAVGERQARSINRRCAGWISEQPDYLLSTDTAFLRLYVLARSREAVSVAVRKPDGSVVCRGKRGQDAVIASDFPIGTSQIWVGVSEENAEASYRLGFSEVNWRPSAIALPEEHE